ncbi:MAG: RnfABCDGE type electron transport complex subunit D [Rhodospirillales bacterium]|nr:RnfABCDGE type electron transport complex subunit D [Rhodospirillales bacterium]
MPGPDRSHRPLDFGLGRLFRSGPNSAVPEIQNGPHIRDGPSLERATRYLVIALIPCLIMAFINTGYQVNVDIAKAGLKQAPGWQGTLIDGLGIGHGPSNFWSAAVHGALFFLPVLAVTVIVGGLWEWIFAIFRKRPLAEGFPTVALLYALMLPPSIPLWLAALGITFGIVVGKEIFGGTGKNFLNPVLVGLAFLYITYPKEMIIETSWTVVDALTSATYYLQNAARGGLGTLSWLGTSWLQSFIGFNPEPFSTTSTMACLFGVGFLLYRRLISPRVIAGVLFGMVAMVLAVNQFGNPANPLVGVTWYWHFVLGNFAFGALFLATDPVTSAMTDKGRWIYGILIGVMVVIIRVANTSHPDGVMFAILFGNIFAPLIDYLVIWANIRRRARRSG